MKAITEDQPRATLVGLGVVTVVARPTTTSYRGPLAIHASSRWPPTRYLPPFRRGYPEVRNLGHWLVIPTITDPAFTGPRPTGSRVPRRAKTPTLFFPGSGPHARRWDPGLGSAIHQGSALYLPLAAIVATATLVDVVPIVVPIGDEGVWDQLGFGDFSPGRYAWVVEEARPVDPPIRCGGRPGLWDAPPEVR